MIKTTILSGIETVIKLSSGLIVIKYIAYTLGPVGVAKFGQFQNFVTFMVFVCSGAFTNGLVKYIAESRDNVDECVNKCRGATGFGLLTLGIISPLLFILSGHLSFFIMETAEYAWVIRCFSGSIFFITLYQILIAILNGRGDLYPLIFSKMFSSLMLLILTVSFMMIWDMDGALLSLTLVQSFAFFFVIIIFLRQPQLFLSWLKPSFNWKKIKLFIPYFGIAIVSAISAPLVLMGVRRYIGMTISWEAAGHWEAAMKIADLYLVILTTALTTYFLPAVSSCKSIREKKILVKKVSIFSVGVSSCMAMVIFLFRAFIVEILFSHEFAAVNDLLDIILLGSVIKIASWVFGFYMIANKQVYAFIFSEIVFGLSFFSLSIWFVNLFGLKGALAAATLNYSLYFIFCFSYYLVSSNRELKREVINVGL